MIRAKKAQVMLTPSLFGCYVTDYFKNEIKTVIEVGCGNGRDSYHLGTKYHVTAVDTANQPSNTDTVIFEQKSMADLDTKQYDLLYSRFSLHSVPESIETEVLTFARQNCTFIAIEARSTKDELYVNDDSSSSALENRKETSYAAAHYRRYLNFEKFQQKMIAMGFEILYAEESDEFSPYKDQKPFCLRIVAKVPTPV